MPLWKEHEMAGLPQWLLLEQQKYHQVISSSQSTRALTRAESAYGSVIQNSRT